MGVRGAKLLVVLCNLIASYHSMHTADLHCLLSHTIICKSDYVETNMEVEMS